MYEDSLHTIWPDLIRFNEGGGKVIHYHGESDMASQAFSVFWRVSLAFNILVFVLPSALRNTVTAAIRAWLQRIRTFSNDQSPASSDPSPTPVDYRYLSVMDDFCWEVAACPGTLRWTDSAIMAEDRRYQGFIILPWCVYRSRH